MKKSVALYAFSADPITNGHINIVERISKTFDSVIVAIGKNPAKKYTYTLDERIELAKQSLSHLDNIKVLTVEGMLVDFAYTHGANVIVKGVRNAADFDYEKMLHMVGESQKLDIDTHILFSEPELSHVSSSTVKSIQSEHGDISSYVPLPVKSSLEKKISNQIILGITGGSASGKSTITDLLVKKGETGDFKIWNLDLDKIGHEVFENISLPLHLNVRNQLANKFGSKVLESSEEYSKINRKALAEIVFNDNEAMAFLNKIMKKPIDILIRKFMKGKNGVILFNGALIAENDYINYCNNRIFIIDVDYEDQKERMKKRGLTEDQVFARLDAQLLGYQKKALIEEKIKESSYGFAHMINTSKHSPEEAASLIYQKIKELL